MTPTEFKAHFIDTLPQLPPEFEAELDLDQFVTYSRERVSELRITDIDKSFLLESGLPADAAPYLNFECKAVEPLSALEDFPESVVIGMNGSGDAICIDMSDGGAIVYYNHDDDMKRVFINSSLQLFAECLCEFSLLLHTKNRTEFIETVRSIDPPALESNAFWAIEIGPVAK